jgi:hypothetical protein
VPQATAVPAAARSAEATCLATPVTFRGKLAPKPVDPQAPSSLLACDREPDPEPCRFTIARAYYDANHYKEAAPIFARVAQAGPKTDVGIYAAQLYMECLNMVLSNADTTPPACTEAIGGATRVYVGLYCSPPGKDDEEACSVFDMVDMDIQRLAAENAVTAGQKLGAGSTDGSALLRKAGGIYMDVFADFCVAHAAANGHTRALPAKVIKDRCPEVLYNAMKAFELGGDATRAASARFALLDPRNGLDGTPLARKVAGTHP